MQLLQHRRSDGIVFVTAVLKMKSKSKQVKVSFSKQTTGLGLFMAIFASVGISLLISVHASTPYASEEAEKGTISGNAAIVSDNSASGGKSVKFSGNATSVGDSSAGGGKSVKPGAYTFDDEFNGPSGSAPNPALWDHDVGGSGWGNQELEYYTDGNANSYLDGQGHLVIEADRYSGSADTCWYGNCKYTSARILTDKSFSQAYGHFEARMEMPDAQPGLWPAFWMLGNNYGTVGWPQCGEIDIMEDYGTDLIQGSLHGPVPANDTAANHYLTSSNLTGWHTYAVDWNPTQVSFSVDGSVYGTTTKAQMGGDWAFDHPFFIIINMAVGGTGTGNVSPNQLPAKTLVDYVRVSS